MHNGVVDLFDESDKYYRNRYIIKIKTFTSKTYYNVRNLVDLIELSLVY